VDEPVEGVQVHPVHHSVVPKCEPGLVSDTDMMLGHPQHGHVITAPAWKRLHHVTLCKGCFTMSHCAKAVLGDMLHSSFGQLNHAVAVLLLLPGMYTLE